jgi:hypothetical protein
MISLDPGLGLPAVAACRLGILAAIVLARQSLRPSGS